MKLQPWEDHPMAFLRTMASNDHFSPSIGHCTAQQKREWQAQQGKPQADRAVARFYTEFKGRRYDQFGLKYGDSIEGNIE